MIAGVLQSPLAENLRHADGQTLSQTIDSYWRPNGAGRDGCLMIRGDSSRALRAIEVRVRAAGRSVR